MYLFLFHLFPQCLELVGELYDIPRPEQTDTSQTEPKTQCLPVDIVNSYGGNTIEKLRLNGDNYCECWLSFF